MKICLPFCRFKWSSFVINFIMPRFNLNRFLLKREKFSNNYISNYTKLKVQFYENIYSLSINILLCLTETFHFLMIYI